MQILWPALLISLGQLLLFGGCGIGLARLLLPPRLHAHELTLAPLFGLALLAIVGYYGANISLSMRQLLPIVLLLALLFIVAALYQTHRSGRRWWPHILPVRETLPLLLILLATWLINIAPVLNYGTLIPIGDNWDVEFYLPLTDYLKDYSYVNSETAPANPLRDLLLTPRLSARAMGATYAQSIADLLLYRDAWDTWVPMLALLRVLTLAGLYALLREGLGVTGAGALAGVALAGLNSLLLWTTYNSFGMGLGGLALLPAALLFLLLALDDLRPGPTTMAAALLLGGITCTYWPMLMAYGAAGLGIGVALLWEQRSGGWGGVVGRGALVLVGGALVGALVHLRAGDAFLGVFTMQTPSMGVSEFISPAVVAGSAAYSHREGFTVGRVDVLLGWVGLAAALLLLIGGVWWGGRRRSIAIGLVLCMLAYLLGLRFVVGFPYGLLRGTSYVNTLLLGMVGAGLAGWRNAKISLPNAARRLLPPASLALFALLLGSSGVASYATYRVYAERPGVFGLDSVGMRAAAAQMEQPGAVVFSSAPELRGPYTGAWAYTLRQRELLGMMATGYQTMVNAQPGAAPAYGLLHRNDDPRAYGFDPTALLWQNDRAALYHAPEGRRSWLNGRASAYTEGDLLRNDTTYSRAQIGTGDYLESDPDKPLELFASADEIFVVPLPGDATPTQRGVGLALASFTPQPVTLQMNDTRHTLDVPMGATFYQTGPVTTPLRLTLQAEEAPLLLRWVSLEEGGASATEPPLLDPLSDTLLLRVASEVQGAGMQTQVHIANPGQHMLRLAVEIYEEVPGYGGDPAHYAWALFPAPLVGEHVLDIDLQSPAIQFDGAPLEVQTGDMRDGHYFAALWVYQGERVRRTVPFARFERRGGTVASITPLDTNAAFARLAPPAQSLDARFDDTIALRGYTLHNPHVRPGGTRTLSLLWHALRQPTDAPVMVFVQVLDAENRKIAQWDGAAGGDWWPTPVWQPGQYIWQDVPLEIATDAAPGRYRVIVGLTSTATGENLTLPDGGTFLGIGEVVVVE